MTTIRPLLRILAAATCIAASHGASAGAVHKCVDPVTRQVSMTDLECPSMRLPTPAEVAASAAAAQAVTIEKEQREAKARAVHQLLNKYPTEASHRQAELVEVNDVTRKIRFSMKRYGELVAERKPLDDQKAFYVGKPLPPELKRAIDANDASFSALTDVFHGLEQDVNDIVARFRTQREQLRPLWAA